MRLPEHPCPNHNSANLLMNAPNYQSIHAQAIIPFIFQCMRLPEHPCPSHNPVHVPRAYGHQSIHAQTIIPFIFESMRLPEHSELSRSMIQAADEEAVATRTFLARHSSHCCLGWRSHVGKAGPHASVEVLPNVQAHELACSPADFLNPVKSQRLGFA